MIVEDILKKLDLKIAGGAEGLNREVTGGYVSDLLSDVMGNADSGEIWITLQTHKNVMAIASLKELAAIIVVNDLEVDEDTLVQSNSENIPILTTSLSTYEVTGRLYQLLNNTTTI